MPDRVAEVSFSGETYVLVGESIDEMLDCALPEDSPGESWERLYRFCQTDAARRLPETDR